MTPWSELKAAAIAKACEIEPWNLAAVVAMLTSPSGEERAQGKAAVRGMMQTGRAALEKEQIAERLREASEKFEP